MNNSHIRLWRLTNLITIGLGLALPWINIYFDNFGPETPPAGWRYFLSAWQGTVNDIYKYGFAIDMWPEWVLSLCALLIVLYMIFDVFSAIKNRDHKGSKLLSVILVGILVIFLLGYFLPIKPYIGYWLINLGILSSAVFEWRSWDSSVSKLSTQS
jgi:hypothetical protein